MLPQAVAIAPTKTIAATVAMTIFSGIQPSHIQNRPA
jgi:hypothetical protein